MVLIVDIVVIAEGEAGEGEEEEVEEGGAVLVEEGGVVLVEEGGVVLVEEGGVVLVRGIGTRRHKRNKTIKNIDRVDTK